jgi:hypothetical protein
MTAVMAAQLEAPRVAIVPTKRDAEKLMAWNESRIGLPRMPRIVVRDSPPELPVTCPAMNKEPHPLIADWAAKDLVIGVAAQRIDPIKMDLAMLDGLKMLLRFAPEEERQHLAKCRLAIFGALQSIPEAWGTLRPVYAKYWEHFRTALDEVNRIFREQCAPDDFIRLHQNEHGAPCHVTHEMLTATIFPRADLAFQVGEEGHCRSLLEFAVVRLLGEPERSKSCTIVISRRIGLIEKFEGMGFRNLSVVEKPQSPISMAAAFRDGFLRSALARERKWTSEADRASLAAYCSSLAPSYYSSVLRELAASYREDTDMNGLTMPKFPFAPIRGPEGSESLRKSGSLRTTIY